MKQAARQEIFKKMALKNLPAHVRLELTRDCNLECVHCMVKHGEKQRGGLLAIPELRSLLSELSALGCFHVNVTGGEPFSRPDALEAISTIFEHDFFLTLQTNGTLLEPDALKLLKKNSKKVRQIGVSLYGVREDVHEYVTGVPGSHAAALEAIMKLSSLKLPVVVVSVMSALNHEEFHALESFCARKGLMFQFNTVIVPRDDGNEAPTRLRLEDKFLCRLPRPWETDWEENSTEAGELGPGQPLAAWCGMGQTTCYITSWGDVRPCSTVNLPAGNLRESSFTDIWNNSPVFKQIRSFRMDQFECFHCEQFSKCRPCPGLAFLEQGSFTEAPREICRITSVFKKKDGEKSESAKKAV